MTGPALSGRHPVEPRLAPTAERRAEPAAVAETHLSWVLLLGEYAVKVKKPVRTDFCDFRTAESRLAACSREVDLNRRLAPDVYLDVLEIRGRTTTVVESAVLMRRMPDRLRLSRLVASGAVVRADVRRVAEVVAAFHAGAARSAAIDRAGRVEAVLGLWRENLGVLRSDAGGLLDSAILARVAARAERYLAGRGDLLEQRVSDRQIVDGHGDLRAEDIFCLPGRPRILDCLEFDDALRHGDVLGDVAFLAMDLERLGAPAEAAAFLDDYRMACEENHPNSLAHLYIAYRAVVRAKVSCLRYGQSGEASAAAEAPEMLALADRHLDAARVRLVLVGGLPGTGKSTVSEALGGHYGWPVLRSDAIRKRLTGTSEAPAPAAPGQGIYRPQWTDATYSAMLDAAERHLRHGQSVILDATWVHRAHRAAAAQLARQTVADLVPIECVTSEGLALRRLRERRRTGRDPSDATADAYRYLAARADPRPRAHHLDTALPLHDTLAGAIHAVDGERVSA